MKPGPGQHLLGERKAHERLHHPPEDVGVVGKRGEHFLHHRVRGRRILAVAQRVHLGDAGAIRCDLVVEEQRHIALGQLVELADERLGVIEARPGRVTKALRVDQPDGDASAGGRVRARPRITDGAHTGCDRTIVDDEPSVSIHDPGHRQHLADRLTVEPVLLQRAGADDLRELLGILEAP